MKAFQSLNERNQTPNISVLLVLLLSTLSKLPILFNCFDRLLFICFDLSTYRGIKFLIVLYFDPILDKPVLDTSNTNQEVTISHTLSLSCLARGYPPISIYNWTKNGVRLNNNQSQLEIFRVEVNNISWKLALNKLSCKETVSRKAFILNRIVACSSNRALIHHTLSWNSALLTLTLPFMMLKNGQTYFKNLAVQTLQDF